MSQEKVDRYKKEKANRKQIMKEKNVFSIWRKPADAFYVPQSFSGPDILFTIIPKTPGLIRLRRLLQK